MQDISGLLRMIRQYNDKEGFNPRVIEMSFDNFTEVREELKSILNGTYFDNSTDSMIINNIRVVHNNQILKVKKFK